MSKVDLIACGFEFNLNKEGVCWMAIKINGSDSIFHCCEYYKEIVEKSKV